MYRVKKANGWNRYKVQKQFLWLFWRDVKCMSFYSKDAAIACCAKLISEG